MHISTHILKRHILLSLLATIMLAGISGCDDNCDDGISTHGEAVGADLSFGIGSHALAQTAIYDGSGTRTTWEEFNAMANNDEIKSLLLMVYRHSEDISDRRILGYRILVKPDTGDGVRYIFRNKTGVINPNTGTPWPDLTLASVGGFHASGDDDAQADAALYGFNNWTTAAHNQAKFNFLFTKPMHGNFEKGVPGDYKAILLVNFNEEVPLCSVPYPDLNHEPLDKGGVTVPQMEVPAFPVGYHVRELLAYWQRNHTDPNFDGIPMDPCVNAGARDQNSTVNNWFIGARYLLHGRVLLSDSHVQSFTQYDADGLRVPMAEDSIRSDSYVWLNSASPMMSAWEDISVTAGLNNYNVDVKRLTSRTTFSIKNKSAKPLTITNFSLSNNYAQAAAYIFTNSNNYGNDSEYSNKWRGSVDVTSPRALMPFNSSTVYSNDGNSHVFFDALTFEASDDAKPMSFTITARIDEVEREGVSSISASYTPYEDMVAALASEAWPIGGRRVFLMHAMRSDNGAVAEYRYKQMFVRNGSTSPMTVDPLYDDISDFDVAFLNDNLQFLFEIEKATSTTVRIRSYDTKEYLKTPTTYNQTIGAKWLTTAFPAEAAEFSLIYTSASNPNPGSIAFEYHHASGNIYPHVDLWNRDTGTKCGDIVAMGKWNDAGSHFRLYPVTIATIADGYLTKTIEVPIQRVEEGLGLSELMNHYKRNEHIRVNINVQYDVYSQQFKFGVEDWTDATHDITFE